ncbi:hypothetical protein ACNAUY_07940 [Acinetobacter tibetensis]|uniref:hypothetical protein n=1 Tax=Acinetobacter tibetensis TaxID=2943497 RepID=UPI003A4D37B7
MPNWCQNSIMIPLAHKKAFMRKFTKGHREREYSSQPASSIFAWPSYRLQNVKRWMSPNRILRAPTDLPEVERNRWRDDFWGCRPNSRTFEFFDHIGDEYDGMFEITFDSAWGEIGEDLIYEIAKRLGCDVTYLWFEGGQEIYGMMEVIHDEDENGRPTIFTQEADDSLDTYETIVTRFFGASEYAEELIIEKYKEVTC